MTLLLAGLATSALSGTLAINQHVIGGGGGTSTGGPYGVTGTIGQPAAGLKMTGGNFALDTGFWSAFIAVQTPGSPTLSIVRAGSNIEITWPAAGSSGFVLEATATLGPTADWILEEVEPTEVDGINKVTLSIQPGAHYFRLVVPE